MTKDTLKAEHPAIYDEILALGKAEEQTRVKAWMAYQEIDPVAVSKGISEGKSVDVAVMAEMQVAAFKKNEIEATAEESVETVETTVENTEKTAEQIQAEKLEKEVYANLGIKAEGGTK